MSTITSIDDPRFVKAMSHPLRVRILAMLDERTASPNQLAGWLGASLGTVAYHVRTLFQLDLIELVDETRVRGAVEHHYRSKPRPRVSVEAWAEASPVAKQAAVGSSLDGDGGVRAAVGRRRRLRSPRGSAPPRPAAARRARLRAALEGLREAARARGADRGRRRQADRGDPSAEDVVETGLGLLLFEAARLAPTTLARAPQPQAHERSAPATGSVVAGAGTEG